MVIPWNAPHPGSGASNRNGDELFHLVRLQAHQHHSLAILVGVPDGIAHIDRGNDLLPGNIEDDVADLETVLEGKSVAIEIDHNDPFRARTCDMLGRREHQTSFGASTRSASALVLLSQKVAADGEENHLFGRIHTSAMERLVWVCRDQTMKKRGFRPMWRGSRA